MALLARAPKTKAQKEAEEREKQKEERKKEEKLAQDAKAARLAEEERVKEEARRQGIVVDHHEKLLAVKHVNTLDSDDELAVTGLDGAIDALTVGEKKKPDEHPERRRKQLYESYFAAQLPIMKEELPGLKLSQYKARIFEDWQSSPENPMNQKA